MADLLRIKNNVAKMVSMNAPESDIDGYISSEGVSLNDIRNFKLPTKAPMFSPSGFMGEQSQITPQDIISGMLPVKGGNILADIIRKRGRETLAPQINPILERMPERPTMVPKSVFDVGMAMGRTRGGGEVGFDFALDPRTWMPGSVSSGVRKPMDIMLEASRKAIAPSTKPGMVARMGAFVGGIGKDILDEVAQGGYRNVLQKKYYDTKLPEQLQGVIENNIGGLWDRAGQKFVEVTTPLRDMPFASEWAGIKNTVTQLAGSVKRNPFKGPSKQLNERIADGIANAKINNLGDVLDLRRFLDEEIYTATGQGIKSDFANKVRKSFNDVLHKEGNPITEQLALADSEWTTLQQVLRDIGNKVTSDTGENFLKRITGLTAKQKEKLAMLEREIGGIPFMQDLTNWGLAQKFLAKPISGGGFTQMLSKATHPILRSTLRTGGDIQNIRKIIAGGTK